jgi:predicted enzyme related to lactoylglutathione lyase
LSSRILLRPADLGRSRRFYRDVLGLAICREFGAPADPGVVFFLGPGSLEVSGRPPGQPGDSVMIWLQVRDVHAEHERLAAAGVRVLRGPATEPWGTDRDVDRGPRRRPDCACRGSRRSPAPPRPATPVTGNVIQRAVNHMRHDSALGAAASGCLAASSLVLFACREYGPGVRVIDGVRSRWRVALVWDAAGAG